MNKRGRRWAIVFIVSSAAWPRPGLESAPLGPDNPVVTIETYVSRDGVHPGETFLAAVRLLIAPGWHINANPAGDDLLLPATVEISGPDGSFKVKEIFYPEGVTARFAFAANEIATYSGAVVIRLTLEAGRGLAPGRHRLDGTAAWQACNDVSCLPPDSRELVLEVAVVPSGAATRAVHEDLFPKDGDNGPGA